MENAKKKRINYSWVIIVISALMVCVVLGFCSSARKFYLTPITDALHIEKSLYSINDSCRFVATAVVNLFFGFLIGKFGAKKLISAGFVCLISSCLIYSFATNIFVFYIGGALLGIGLSWTTTTMVGYVVNKWCSSNRGTIMGLILATNGIGGWMAAKLLTPIIHSGVFGYQNAYRLVALILLGVFVLVIIFFKNSPKGAEGETANAPKKKGRGQSWVGIEYSDAVKKAYLYSALVCIFLTGMILQSITGIDVSHMEAVGLEEKFFSNVAGIGLFILSFSKFFTGFLYDRFGLRTTTNICMIAAVISIFSLANVSVSLTGKFLAWEYAVLSSIALPLETIMLPIYASDLFGEKSFNKILGLFVSVNTAGYALGAPVSNLCFDITGSYNVALYVCCGLMLAVMITMNGVISASNKQRKLIEQKTSVQ